MFSPKSTPFAASLLHGLPSAESEGSGSGLLTAREVAATLGVCRDTVCELCARGELPHVRVLHAIRVTPVDLQRFIAVRRGPTSRESDGVKIGTKER